MDIRAFRLRPSAIQFIRSAALISSLLGSPISVLSQSQDDALQRGLEAFEAGKYQLAEALLRPQAEQGDTEAQLTLAKILESGQGSYQDKAEAEEWYRLAAENGDAEAQFCYGILLAEELDADEVVNTEAGFWIKEAAAGGHPQAKMVYQSMMNQDFTIGC